ncbi:MAG: hypothetical protein M0Z82_16805 [Actinomycetota bacterium]|nr:hypothetical protein [Actinomycetota bacterium]
MESEIRATLTDVVSVPAGSTGLAQALLARFGPLGGVELDVPARTDEPRLAAQRRSCPSSCARTPTPASWPG